MACCASAHARGARHRRAVAAAVGVIRYQAAVNTVAAMVPHELVRELWALGAKPYH